MAGDGILVFDKKTTKDSKPPTRDAANQIPAIQFVGSGIIQPESDITVGNR
jgi:hypothetical protein